MSESGVRILLPPDAGPELIARLRAAFPDAALGEAAPVPSPPLEEILERAIQRARELPGLLADWWSGLGGGFWPLVVFALALVGAWGVEALARRVAAGRATGPAQAGAGFAARAGLGVIWLLGRALSLGVFFAAASILVRLIAGDDAALVSALRAGLAPVMLARIQLALIEFVAAPRAPERRPTCFADADAAQVVSTVRIGVAVFFVSLMARVAIGQAVGTGELGLAARAALITLAAATQMWVFWRLRFPIRDLVLRAPMAADGARSRFGRFVAGRLAWLYIAFIGLDLAIRLSGLFGALGEGGTSGAGPTLMILILAPLAVAGLRVWRAEREADAAGTTARGFGAGGFALAEGAVIVAAALFLLRAWGVDPFAPPPPGGFGSLLPGAIEAALAVVVGVALWRTASAILAPPGGDPLAAGSEGPMRARGRLGTILPILKIFALAVIGVMTGMTALTAIGVDIAPLLAGAGVLGLAIGFGAQKLVADIISGLFYLYEDAFRIGEYIETGAGKGAVERFTLRSVVLRHHRGALFTIPFSDMGTIQNHSRDWVKVKFLFDVPASTDLETVRKIVKKIGAELEADPELAGKFLEPLKSQGAVAIKGRSYQIACKFMTRPGDQFLARRKIFAALQRGLRDNGVELFAPQLTVATGDPVRPAEPSPAG